MALSLPKSYYNMFATRRQRFILFLSSLLNVPTISESITTATKPQTHQTIPMTESETESASVVLSKGNASLRRLRLYLVRHGESEANERGIFAGQLDSPLTERGISEAKSLGEASVFLPPRPPTLKLGQVQQTERHSHGGLPFDRVYSSDLSRAHDTCKFMLEGLRNRRLVNGDHKFPDMDSDVALCDTRLDRRLRERSYGTLQGMPWSSDRSETDKIWRDTRSGEEPPPIWESDDDIWIRVKPFLLDLIEEEVSAAALTNTAHGGDEATDGVPPKHILITSHGGVLRQILMRLVGIEKLKDMGATFDTTRKNKLITPNTSLTILELSFRPDQLDTTGQNGNQHDDKSEDDFRGVHVEMIAFAATDHLNGDVRMHND